MKSLSAYEGPTFTHPVSTSLFPSQSTSNSFLPRRPRLHKRGTKLHPFRELLTHIEGGPLPLIELEESLRVTNQELFIISWKLRGNWRKFGEYFGFQTEDLNLIDKENGHDVYRCLRMLKLWTSWKKDSDGFMETINALKECDAMEIPVEILARGPEAWKLFQVAIEDGHIRVNMTPIRIIGQENTGKTCLMNSLLGKKFNKEHIITDAIATTTFSCINIKENKNEWAQHEGEHDGRFEDVVANKIVEQFKQKKSISTPLIDEFSIAKKRRKLDPHPKSTKEGPNESPEVTTIANLATSSALVQESKVLKYTKGMVQKVEKALKGEDEAPDEDIIKIWDYGGQPIYHSIHRFYIRPLGIYIATFKLTDDLDAFTQIEDSLGNLHRYHMTNLEHLLYWISSPYNHCSVSQHDAELGLDLPISIVVGTHRNSLAGTEEEKKSKVKQIFDKIHKAIEDKPYESHVYPIFFDVENQLSSSDENICKLKEVILKIMDKMKKRIPVKWLHFLIAILKIGEETLILPLNEVNLKAQECGITDDKTIELAIKFFSDVGEVMYHPTEEALRDIVVLKPMGLVEYVKTVFTIKTPVLRDSMLKEWRDLEKGFLRKSLLKHLWQKFPIFADDKDEKTFNFFVSLMKKFGLICGGNTTSDQVFYAFPHLQPVTDSVSLKGDERDGNDKVSIFHDFRGYLPDHLFQLACTRLIEQVEVEQPSEPKLEYNHIEMDFDKYHLVSLAVTTIKHRRMFKTTIIRRQKEGATDVDEPEPETCKKVLALLNKVLEDLRCISRRAIRYQTCVPCSDDLEDMHIVENFNTDMVPCGRVLKSIARYCRLFGVRRPASSSHQQPIPDISQEDYRRLLKVVSKWWHGRGNINMLKVLLRQFRPKVSHVDLQRTDNVHDLFRLLEATGDLSKSNLAIVFEAFKVCGLYGVDFEIQPIVPSFKSFNEVDIKVFSTYRQKLITFGKSLSMESIRTIGDVTDIVMEVGKCQIDLYRKDQWLLICALEDKEIINENSLVDFIQLLRDNCMDREADVLEKLP